MDERIRVFLCYSHKDEVFKERLIVHLNSSRLKSLIDIWDDRQLVAGIDWKQEISERLDQADLILLLVSADFLSSAHCGVELQRARSRHQDGLASLVPIIVKDCHWRHELGQLQALPKNGTPVTDPQRDESWTEVVTGIKRVVDDLQRRRNERSAELLVLRQENRDLKLKLEELRKRPQPPPSATATVPAAYRLVYQHHRAVFALLSELSSGLSSLGLRFDRWDPMYNARPPKSTSEYFGDNYWTWDLLPAHSIRQIWLGPGLRCYVETVSDTGFKKSQSKTEPNPTYFKPLSESKAEIWLSVFASTSTKVHWDKVWNSWKEAKCGDLYDGQNHYHQLDGEHYIYHFFELEAQVLLDGGQGLARGNQPLLDPVLDWLKRFRLPPSVRILPMSREITPSYEELQRFFTETLRTKSTPGQYHYRRNAMVAEPHTVVLFQYDGGIVAQARLLESRSGSSEDGDTTGFYLFDPQSILYYRKKLDLTTLNQIWPDITLGNAQQKLDPRQYLLYERILAEGGFVPPKC